MPKFEREVEIDATVEKVWEAITNPTYWPQWFPGIESVSDVTAVKAGGTFKFKKGDQTGKGTITKFEPPKRMDILTQLGDDKDAHVFKLRSSGGFLGLGDDECTVEYTLDTLMGGGILGSFLAGGNPVDAMKVKKAMTLFRRLVETL